MESFPSDINPSVYSVEWSKLFVDCIYGSQPAIYGPPAGHNWSNSNLLTSINRAITFYGARSSNFLSTCIDHQKKTGEKAAGEWGRYLWVIIPYKWSYVDGNKMNVTFHHSDCYNIWTTGKAVCDQRLRGGPPTKLQPIYLGPKPAQYFEETGPPHQGPQGPPHWGPQDPPVAVFRPRPPTC